MEFYFDLASPFTYLAAERVERSFADVLWIPAAAAVVTPGRRGGDAERELAMARAAELRLPLVWPERPRAEVPAAMRVASQAAEEERAAAFVVAACRLAWAGGFDLDDLEVLAEAAAASSLVVEDVPAVAREASRDAAIADAGRRIRAAGADRLPALRIGHAVFAGEDRVAEAAAYARLRAAGGA